MVYYYDMKCSYLPRGTYTDYRGMALYPLEAAKLKQQSTRSCPLKKKGGIPVYPRKHSTFSLSLIVGKLTLY